MGFYKLGEKQANRLGLLQMPANEGHTYPIPPEKEDMAHHGRGHRNQASNHKVASSNQ